MHISVTDIFRLMVTGSKDLLCDYMPFLMPIKQTGESKSLTGLHPFFIYQPTPVRRYVIISLSLPTSEVTVQ